MFFSASFERTRHRVQINGIKRFEGQAVGHVQFCIPSRDVTQTGKLGEVRYVFALRTPLLGL